MHQNRNYQSGHTQQLKRLKALDRLAVRSTTTITRNRSVEIMIDLMLIELMIQKTGISAYIRLKNN